MINIPLLLILLLPSASFAAVFPYLKVESFAYTEPTPYNEFISDWSSGFRGGDQTIQHIWIEEGLSYDGWGLGIVRQDYGSLHFSTDMAEFYYLSENRLPMPLNRRFEIDIRSHYISVSGIRLFKSFAPTSNSQIKAAVSMLRGKELLQGRIYGDVTVLNEDDYNFDQVKIDSQRTIPSYFLKPY